jgi:hypothetical protein
LAVVTTETKMLHPNYLPVARKAKNQWLAVAQVEPKVLKVRLLVPAAPVVPANFLRKALMNVRPGLAKNSMSPSVDLMKS